MAGDLVKYEYAQLEQMSSELQKGAQRLEQTKSVVAKAANAMQQGAFLGQAGEHLASALAGQFSKSIDNLAHFYTDMARGIQQAANDMKQADQNAASKF